MLDSRRVPFFQIRVERGGVSKHCKTKTSIIISHHHPYQKKHTKNNQQQKEEEEGGGGGEGMVRLGCLYTTQYRKDSLLSRISVTRDVSHFSKFEVN